MADDSIIHLLTGTNEFLLSWLDCAQRAFHVPPHLLLERLHLVLQGRRVAARGLLLPSRRLLLLLLPGRLLLLLSLASGPVLVPRSLAAALSGLLLLLRGDLLLLLLLLHVLAVGSLLAGPALAGAVLGSAGRLVRVVVIA